MTGRLSDDFETENVFLDTEVFESAGRDFSAKAMRRLIELIESGVLRLYLTSVTVAEIRSHLDADLKDSLKALSNYKRYSKLLKRIIPTPNLENEDEGNLRAELHAEFDAFIKESKAEIVDATDVCAQSVLDDYFAVRAPFGKDNKKHEFPDAIAIKSITSWCESNEECTFVVSGDKDWVRATKRESRLRHFRTINELFECFLDDTTLVARIKELLESQEDELRQEILLAAEQLEFSVDEDLLNLEILNPEISDLVISDVSWDDLHVVDVGDGEATVSVFCKFLVSATIRVDDDSTAWKDPVTKEIKWSGTLSDELKEDFESFVEIRVSYEGRKPDALEIIDAVFETSEFEFDVGELSLEVDYDEEDCE